MKRDFLTLADFSTQELKEMIESAIKLKEERKNGIFRKYLENKKVALIFEKSSTRTRVSFEVGVAEMGGYPLFLSRNDIQLARGESIRDTARTLSRYVDMVMIRTFEHERIEEFAKFASVPVINGLTNEFHPCQVMADIMTIYEKMGKYEGVKLAYVGDGNNMAHSLLIGCAKFGIDISIATPEKYQCLQDVVEKAKTIAAETGAKIEITNDPFKAVKGADFIYTDVWASMGFEDEAEERKKIFIDYQVNKNLLEATGKRTYFMHCLPAHLGEEVTEEVFESEISIVFDEAENRLHAQKAIMKWLFEQIDN
ncbi:ornithine carbamoyltransferase [Deferribacter desulfuricans SSM1]|uniref:Ornithine carbamoyltransferase n=1 Tax=Deferribacter desulfuricans (strain DSM 14783 / JCM 11476 / NBRC 101012 / SSM1) TaxID=639282 RepID=D3P8P6_DEFDS|nr:ornithine carbamoyltransferase [Deferribacter desulfuricans]BAI81086.1 ornithine carbamoyltransferase [Deferribacter desulfuricans SSM1]